MYIEITNVGNIEKTHIETSNLTIFLGKNGTNKSYIAHTIYMVNKILNKILSELSENHMIELFENFIKSLNESDFKAIISSLKFEKTNISKEIDTFLSLLSDTIKEYKVELENSGKETMLFNIVSFLTEKILFELNRSFNVNKEIVGNITFKNYKLEIDSILDDVYIRIIDLEEDIDSNNIDDIYERRALYQIFKRIIKNFSEKNTISKESYYFPASRTGFVLAFDDIVSGVLRDRFGGQPTSTKLTESTIDFISNFADIKSGNFDKKNIFLKKSQIEKQSDIGLIFNFINKRIVFGEIIEERDDNDRYTQFLLKPIGSNNKIEMHLTSSSIVELLPLIIFLKHFTSLKDKFLVIEEPEAHFHPKAQIEIARLLIILVNLGAKVLITTHSDYILSEINNCIKLNEIDSKEKYLKELNLPEEILIDKEKVKAYLFKDKEDGQSVKVEELHIDDYGISNKNFDDVLDELIDRTEKINMEL